jgi:amidase
MAKVAAVSDERVTGSKSHLGPLAGIPVLVNDSFDVRGLPTSAGSIALENNYPPADSTVVAKLKAAGAIILGDTNTTEFENEMEPSEMPQGYSSLGGQLLLPSATNKSPGGSSAGSASAVSAGLAPLAIGLEVSSESGQLIAPAQNAGLVGLKPTVGLVSRSGILPAPPPSSRGGRSGRPCPTWPRPST